MPGRSRRYLAGCPLPSRFFGHGEKHPHRLLMRRATKRRETGRGQVRLLDRQALSFLEQTAKPSDGEARPPLRILLGDERSQ